MEIKMMEEEEMVPLNWDSLITNEGVFEAIKEELDALSLKDAQIFKPMTKEVEVEYEELEETDPFGDTTKD
jgi:hypothetical protein